MCGAQDTGTLVTVVSRFPMTVRVGGAELSIVGHDQFASRELNEDCWTVQVYGARGGSYHMTLGTQALRAWADLIYRFVGEQPRAVDQAVRVVVEHVAAAPPAALERSAEDTEKEVIKLRLMK